MAGQCIILMGVSGTGKTGDPVGPPVARSVGVHLDGVDAIIVLRDTVAEEAPRTLAHVVHRVGQCLLLATRRDDDGLDGLALVAALDFHN